MAALPPIGSYEYLNQDTDSVFQARTEIEGNVHRLNGTIMYLAELFGWSGTKETAIATLFSNQAVLFPAGTRLWFHQIFPPPGWVQLTGFAQCYLQAVPYPGGDQWFGNNEQLIPTSMTTLLQQHLPSCQFYGTTDFHGFHQHGYIHTIVDYQFGNVAFERDANGPKAFARYEARLSDGGGVHNHNATVGSGGSGWGHDHYINMSGYRPYTTTGIIALKA